MKKILILFIFLLLLIGCKNEGEIEASHVIHVDINKKVSFDISETAEIVDIVSLELTDNSMIKDISRIYVTDYYILIADLIKSEVYLFNRSDGKFIRNIGRKGQGPGEYIMFNDMFYDEDSGVVYAHERIKRSMHVYDLSGELIKEVPCKYWFNSFCKNKDGFWVYSCYPDENPKGYALMLLDENLEDRVEGFLSQKSFFPTLEGRRFFKDTNNHFYFIYPFSNTIYQLDNGKPKSYFQIDFGSKTLPYKRIQKMSDTKEYEELMYNSDYLSDILNPHIYNNKFYFSFSHTSQTSYRYSAIYDLSKKEVKLFSGFKKYLPENPTGLKLRDITFMEPVGVHKDELIYSINPDMLSEEDFSLLKESISSLLDRESNPILFFVREI